MTYPVRKEPCASCPYRRDVPSGVWASEEYEKLLHYSPQDAVTMDIALGTFMCHQPHERAETLCRGWLSVEAESVAVRLGVLKGNIDPDDPYNEVKTPLFDTGAEAAAHGLRQMTTPSDAAVHMSQKILKKRQNNPV